MKPEEHYAGTWNTVRSPIAEQIHWSSNLLTMGETQALNGGGQYSIHPHV